MVSLHEHYAYPLRPSPKSESSATGSSPLSFDAGDTGAKSCEHKKCNMRKFHAYWAQFHYNYPRGSVLCK